MTVLYVSAIPHSFDVSLCCTCLHSHFGIPMSLLDYYSVIPATPVRLGTMALPPLAGSAHSHRSLASS